MNYFLISRISKTQFVKTKKNLFLFAFLLFSIIGKAQFDSVVHTGELLNISSGENVYIMGSFTDMSVAGSVGNEGTIHLQGDLRNTGTNNIFGTTPATVSGTLRFFGVTPSFNARIFGTDTINFRNLTIDLDNPALTGNVLLRYSQINAAGDVRFLNGGFDLDHNVLNLVYIPSSLITSGGIIAESNTARALVLTDNPDGKITLSNFPFTSGTTYSNLKGMGLGFYLDNPLTVSTVSPVLTRTFQSQACGDSIGHVGSINRVFRMEGNTLNPLFKNANIKFLNPSELAGNNQDSMHIFVSEDRAQIWRQRLNNTGDADSVTSDGSTYFTFAPNYTVITAANYAPCVMEPILINQIITGITPNDTLFSISTAVSCSSPVNVRLYATGEPGAFIEWRDPINNLYTAQGTDGYYDALSLGTYWVRLTNIRGCMDSLSIVVVDVLPGSAAIGTHPSQLCIGNSVSFSPVSTLSTSTYNWNFGDGTTASTSTASHLYTTIGTYTITLVVTTAQGCLSSSTSTIQINALPVPSFSSGPVCAGLAMNFNNSTTVISLPTTVDLNWDFGDGVTDSTTDNISGTSSATGDISHIYSVAGTYNVILTALANGCSSDTTISVTVYPLPVVDFTFSSACQGAAVVFTNSSSISDASSLSYLWDFNNGSGPTSSTVDPSYSYGPTATGTYTVSLTATSSNGCVSDTVQAITIAPNPVANFTTTNACQGTSLTNNLASFVNGTTPLAGNTYAWTFGDGNTGTGALSEINAYASPGTYTVSLVVTTAGGCVGSVNNNVIIYPIPSVSFSSQPAACSGENVIFTNTTSPTSSTYVWLFPSTPTSSTSINVSQAFSNPGTSAITVPITLTATSLNGCSASSTNSITINPLPILSLGDSITTCGTTYPLDANPGGVNAGSSYLWNTLATTDSILVALNGTYSVTVTSPSGCINSESVSVTLNGTVLPTLGADATFCDNTVLDAGYPGSTYLWSTGATSQTITITAPGPGTYSVTVTDVNGCIGTNSVNITIVPSTPVSLGLDTVECASTGVVLNAGIATTYVWTNVSTGAIVSTASTLTVPATGEYAVQITNSGCSSTDTIVVTLNASPSFSLGPDATICDQLFLNATIPLGGPYSYSWNTLAVSPAITVTSTGTYNVLITNTSTLCSAIDSIDVIINPLPTVALGSDTSLCSYQTITLDAGNTGSSFVWNSGQTTQTINVSASGTYSVTVTDGFGCSSSDPIQVTILPVFSIDLGPDKPFCPGSTLILDAGLTTSGNTYLWENSSTILTTTATYTVADTGMYYLTVSDSYNCLANDSVKVIPSNISLYALFLAASEIIEGQELVFINLSYPRPYTSQWYLDNVLVTNDSSPTIAFNGPVSPPSDIIYVTLKVNNGYCTSILTKPITVSPAFMPVPTEGEKPVTPKEEALFSQINQVNLYPNPNSGIFNFSIDITKETIAMINIYSITGALVYSEKRFVSSGVIPYDFQELNPGMYFFTIEIFNEKRTLKFIKTPN